jgi:Icc-related predicted phosphoesterase
MTVKFSESFKFQGKEVAVLRFIAFGNIIANQEVLKRIASTDLSRYDAAIFTGDIPNPEGLKKLRKEMVEAGLGDRVDVSKETQPPEALRQMEIEIREAKDLFAEISRRIKIIGVWGNSDHTMDKISVEDHIEIIHNRVLRIGDLYLLGYNGRSLYIFEKENRDEWAFAEEKIYADLHKLFKELEGKEVILVTHVPPYGILDQVVKEYREYGIRTYGERARDGHMSVPV